MNDIVSEPAHAIFSPSGASRWMSCTASIPLVMELTKAHPAGSLDFESVYAAEGTSAHELLEQCVKEGFTDAEKYIGHRFYTHEVDQEMADSVNLCLAEIEMVLDQWGLTPADVTTEQRVYMPSIHPTLCFGTVDITILDPKNRRFAIMDLKYGKGVIVPRSTSQLRFYAIGVLDSYLANASDTSSASNPDPLQQNPIVSGWDLYDEFYPGIMQPRIPNAQDSAIDLDDPVPVWELEESKEEYALAVQAIMAGDVSYAPKYDTCRWCKASQMGACKAQDGEMLSTLADEFADLPVEPNELTLATILAVAPAIREWLLAKEAKALALMIQGEEIEGFKMIRGLAFRNWVDPEQTIRELEPLLKEDLYTKKILSPAQVEKKIGKAAARTMLQHLIEAPIGKLKVAPSDARGREITVFDLNEDDLAGS